MTTTEYRIAMQAVDPPQDFVSEDQTIAFTFVNEVQIAHWTETLGEAEDWLEAIEDRIPGVTDLMEIQSREVSDWTAVE